MGKKSDTDKVSDFFFVKPNPVQTSRGDENPEAVLLSNIIIFSRNPRVLLDIFVDEESRGNIWKCQLFFYIIAIILRQDSETRDECKKWKSCVRILAICGIYNKGC